MSTKIKSLEIRSKLGMQKINFDLAVTHVNFWKQNTVFSPKQAVLIVFQTNMFMGKMFLNLSCVSLFSEEVKSSMKS